MKCYYEAETRSSISYLSSCIAIDKSESKMWYLMTSEYRNISFFDNYIEKSLELNEKKKNKRLEHESIFFHIFVYLQPIMYHFQLY